MHPDKKVGLSLGILLIGVTAAFFFRNDVPNDQAQAPELVDPESLDEQIRRKSQTPYLPERADEVAAADEAETPEVRDVAAVDVLPPQPDLSQSVPASPLFEPIRPVEESPVGRIAPIPHPSGDVDEVGQALSRVDPDHQPLTSAASDSQRPQFHVVVANDTLSAISQKYLGSSRRYREIFEANRDQLDSPDDIREGMKLRIPNGESRSGNSAANTSARVTNDAGQSPQTEAVEVPATESASPRPSFVRPRSNGRLPGRRTSMRSGQSLSQDPPPDLPTVAGFSPDQARAVIASRPLDEPVDVPAASDGE